MTDAMRHGGCHVGRDVGGARRGPPAATSARAFAGAPVDPTATSAPPPAAVAATGAALAAPPRATASASSVLGCAPFAAAGRFRAGCPARPRAGA